MLLKIIGLLQSFKNKIFTVKQLNHMQTSAGSINSKVFEIKRHVGMRVYFRDQIHMGNKRLIDVQRKQMCVGDKEENYRHSVCLCMSN